MAGVKSMLMNERWRQIHQQSIAKSLKTLCLVRPYRHGQGPAYSKAQLEILRPRQEARTNTILKRGKCKCDLAAYWCMKGAFPQACVLRNPALILKLTSVNISNDAFWSALFTYNNHSYQLLPSTPPWPLKMEETAWLIRLWNKSSAITGSPPVSILCQFHPITMVFFGKDAGHVTPRAWVRNLWLKWL